MPEGIVFKHLPAYHQELQEIYSKLRRGIINRLFSKSIDDVIDPFNNSISEKCARIREAFIRNFDEYLAKNNYTDGKRGEAKNILLLRELVTWDKIPPSGSSEKPLNVASAPQRGASPHSRRRRNKRGRHPDAFVGIILSILCICAKNKQCSYFSGAFLCPFGMLGSLFNLNLMLPVNEIGKVNIIRFYYKEPRHPDVRCLAL